MSIKGVLRGDGTGQYTRFQAEAVGIKFDQRGASLRHRTIHKDSGRGYSDQADQRRAAGERYRIIRKDSGRGCRDQSRSTWCFGRTAQDNKAWRREEETQERQERKEEDNGKSKNSNQRLGHI